MLSATQNEQADSILKARNESIESAEKQNLKFIFVYNDTVPKYVSATVFLQ